MKECQIIEIKTTTRALQGGRDDIRFASMHMRDDVFRCHEDGAMIQPMGKIDTERRRVVKLQRHTAHRTDTTYVVWSPEVEALLSTPLDMINELHRERDVLLAIVSKCKAQTELANKKFSQANGGAGYWHQMYQKYTSCTLWQRIKFVFTGSIG